MPGLVVEYNGDGDLAWAVVDDALWKQICGLRDSVPDNRAGTAAFREFVSWLTCSDPEIEKPPTFEGKREGKILKTFYTQSPVIEDVTFDGIVGVLHIS